MKIQYNNMLEADERQVMQVTGNRVRIGRNPDNDIVLNSPFVPGEAAVLYRQKPGGAVWELVVLGLDSMQVNGADVRGGARVVIDRSQTVRVFPFTITFDLPQQSGSSEEALRARLDREMGDLLKEVHRQLLERMDVNVSTESRRESDEYLQNMERALTEIARLLGLLEPPRQTLLKWVAAHGVRTQLLQTVVAQAEQSPSAVWNETHRWSRLFTAVPDRETEMEQTVSYVAQRLQLKNLPDVTERADCVERRFWEEWKTLVRELSPDFVQYVALRQLKKEVKDIVFGYGPLEDLLRTPTVSEIMVVDREHIYIERQGVVENSGRRFISDEITQSIIERIVSKVGRRIDKSRPLVDARLSDGSRVNAVIPPLAVSGPCLTVRKFPARKLLVDDLILKGTLTRTVAEFLKAAVLNRCNILISGGTGTGKTTLLNCLSDFIPDKERIVTIEDTAELQLSKEHVVRLETKPANVEGAGEYTIHDLVKNALRMRPDRIVVGECRGPEALDMLQAMNTGHDGSMTTIHANTAEDVILRLEVLVQMAADLPTDSIHRQIASAINLIVQLSRLRDGSRRISQVSEVFGVDEASGQVRMKDLFALDETETGPLLRPTGRLPTFMDRLIDRELIRMDAFYL